MDLRVGSKILTLKNFPCITILYCVFAICEILNIYHKNAESHECYSELMPYTVQANSYWVSVHEAYQYQGHAH